MKINDFNSILGCFHKSKILEIYQLQENVLKCVVKQYPSHNSKAAVELKVKLLNSFYSTNIKAVQQMANHIFKIPNIDNRLLNGDKTLVGDIACLNGRNFYSFATKYCALHQPTLFPIFDSIVSDTFKRLLRNNKLSPQYNYCKCVASNAANSYNLKSFEKRILRDYIKYYTLYKYFMNISGIGLQSMRDVDWYIWGGLKLNIHFDLKKFI